MATYYVSTTGDDTNGTGSQLNPFQTFGKADSLLLPGDTVLVVPSGIYAQSSTLITAASGTLNARVTWKSSVPNVRPQVSGSMNNQDLWQAKGNYCDIIGFDITATLAKIGLSNWGHHNRLLKHRAHDIGTGLANGAAGAGLFDFSFSATGQNEWAYNTAINCGPAGSSNTTTFHGLYISTFAAFIHDNMSSGNASWGFALAGIDTNNFQVVCNNLAFGNTFGGFKMTGEGSTNADFNDIANNISYGNGRLGITGTGFIDQALIGTHNTYRNNCIFGNVGVNYVLQNANISGSILADPQFVNYQSDGSGDYRLKATSPCIDAGVVTSPASVLDFIGTLRPQGSAIDVGPYELIAQLAASKGGLSLIGA